jgi:hypothetical protein
MRYWSMVKNMDNNLKLELVAMLVDSVRERPAVVDEEELERGFRSLAGCWANDYGDDDMEAIIRSGRSGRHGSRIVPSFDD